MYCRVDGRTRRPSAATSIYVQPRYGTLTLSGVSGASELKCQVPVGVEITLFDLELCLFMVPMLDRPSFSYRTSAHRFFNEDNRENYAELHLYWPGTVPALGRRVFKDDSALI